MQRPHFTKGVDLSGPGAHVWEEGSCCWVLRNNELWASLSPEEALQGALMLLDGQIVTAHATTGLLHFSGYTLGNFGELLVCAPPHSADTSCACCRSPCFCWFTCEKQVAMLGYLIMLFAGHKLLTGSVEGMSHQVLCGTPFCRLQ
jgi:hypothetical protein